MKKTFKCHCKGHLIEISYESVIEWTNIKTKKKHKNNTAELCIAIYEVYGGKSGRKLKKPKLIGDVVFLACAQDSKEMDNIIKFLENVVMAYTIRKK